MVPRSDSTDGWVTRLDRGPLLASHVRPDGTLLVEGFAAREGIYEYRQADGSVVRELVTMDALRSGAASLGRAPVTLGHPAEDVTPETFGRDGVGDVDGDVSIEQGGFTRVRMAVRRKDAIAAVRGGTVELSPGYRVRIDPTPGEHPTHGRYDQRQVERVTNHLAIVDMARGGAEIRLRADSAVAVHVIRLDTPDNGTGGVPPQREVTMTPGMARLLAMLGITSRVDSDAAGFDAAIAKLEQQRSDASDATTKLAAEKARADTEKARADAAEAKVKTLEDAEKARADKADRADLDDLAKALGVDPTKHVTALELRKAIAQAHLGAAYRADGGVEYDRAVCDLASTKAASADAGRQAGNDAWGAATRGNDQPNDPGRQDAQPRVRRGPGALSRMHQQAAFEAGRKGGA